MSRRLLRSLYTVGRFDSPSIACQSFHSSRGKKYMYLFFFFFFHCRSVIIALDCKLGYFCDFLKIFINLLTDLYGHLCGDNLLTSGSSGLFKVHSC
jgi:hypothetical protein